MIAKSYLLLLNGSHYFLSSIGTMKACLPIGSIILASSTFAMTMNMAIAATAMAGSIAITLLLFCLLQLFLLRPFVFCNFHFHY